MVDPRFYAAPIPETLTALLGRVGASAPTDRRAAHLLINSASELIMADSACISLAIKQSYSGLLAESQAGAVVVSRDLLEIVPATAIAIVSDRPHELFVDLLDALYPNTTRTLAALYPSHDADPQLEENVVLGTNVVIGLGAEIGRNTVIGANCVIGTGVTIGRDCIIAANCTIECAHLGNRVVVHAGARIGTEGFGWLGHGAANRKIPQLGRVIVQDRCEIGPNATIDRGALGDTVLGEGTKLGNIVVIGHNSQLGRNCLVAPTSGLAGSTILGDGVIMGAGVGTSGHLTVGAGSVVHARAAVTKNWPPGSMLAGLPAQDVRGFWREIATVRRLMKKEHR